MDDRGAVKIVGFQRMDQAAKQQGLAAGIGSIFPGPFGEDFPGFRLPAGDGIGRGVKKKQGGLFEVTLVDGFFADQTDEVAGQRHHVSLPHSSGAGWLPAFRVSPYA